MNFGYKILLFYLISFCINNCGYSQESDISFQHLNTNSGLSSNGVHQILEDDKGFIWISTSFGLNRYDGEHIKQYHVAKDDSLGLSSETTREMVLDKFHTIWFTTSKAFCYLNTDQGNHIKSIYKIGNDSLLNSRSALLIDSNGDLWTFFKEKMYCFQIAGVGKLIKKKEFEFKDPMSMLGWIFFIKEDSRKTIWFASHKGLFKIERNKKIEKINLKKEIVKGHDLPLVLYSCYPQNDSIIWFGCHEVGGLLKYNKNTGNVKSYQFAKSDNLHYQTNIVCDISEVKGNDNELWIASRDRGLMKFKIKQEQFEFYKHNPENPLSMSVSSANYVTSDAQENIWIATNKGLNIILKNKQIFKTHHFPFVSENQRENELQFVLPDWRYAHNHILWVSTNGNGLFKYNTQTSEYKKINLPRINKTNERIRELIMDASIDPNDSSKIWLSGVETCFILNTKSEIIEEIRPKNTELPEHDAFERIYAYKDSMVAFCSGEHGLFIFNKKTKQIKNFNFSKNLVFNQAIACVRDSAGNYYGFGLAFDVISISADLKKYQHFSLRDKIKNRGDYEINDAFLKDDTSAWVSTSEGFWVVNLVTKNCRRITFGGNDNCDFFSFIEKESNGNLWIVTISGILHYDVKTGESRMFGNKFNVSTTSRYGLLKFTNTGNFYYSQIGLFNYFNPKDISKKERPLDVKITSFFANGNEIDLFYDKGKIVPIKLSSEKNNIQINFAALNLDPVNSGEYYYQLEGLSNDWISSSGSSNAIFTNLRGGHYNFQVKLKDIYGNFGPSALTLSFYLAPKFYQTWWFYLIISGVVLSIVIIIFRIRINQLKKMEQIRTRIAADLHDDIGSALSSISILSGVASNKIEENKDETTTLIKQIGENSRVTIENMSDIIWSVKPKNDSIEQITIRMKQFASSVFEAKDILFEFKVSKSLFTIKLSMELRRNLYLVFKEAINNISKYSNCKFVVIDLDVKNSFLFLTIKDNGKGFDLENLHHGNGIENMEERAKTCGGTFKIISEIGKGTSVILTLPVPLLRYRRKKSN